MSLCRTEGFIEYQRIGRILNEARGSQSQVKFAKRLGLSYTFVRSCLGGLRLPSDEVLLNMARRLSLDPRDLLVAAYCDRSPALALALRDKGLETVDLEAIEGAFSPEMEAIDRDMVREREEREERKRLREEGQPNGPAQESQNGTRSSPLSLSEIQRYIGGP